MRKLWLFPLLCLLLCAFCFTAVSASEAVVFVSSGATGTGASAEDPVGTLAEAYTVLDDAGGTLVLMNEYALGTKIDLAAHTGTIKWTSVYDGVDYRESGAALKWTASVRIGMGGPTEIDHFHFIDAGAGVLAANFRPLTIGADVSFTDVNGTAVYKTAVVGGPNNDSTKSALAKSESSTLTINGGTYLSITAFSNSVAGLSHEGTMTVNLSGNTAVTNCFLGARGTNAHGGTTILNIGDNTKINGTLYLSSTNASNTPIDSNGSVTVNATGNATVAKILGYLASYFDNGTRTLNYESTVTLPGTLTTYFDTITQTDAVTDNFDTVYVKDGGEGNGAAADAPIDTFANAYALLGEDGGEIVLVGDTTIASDLTLAELAGNVTVTAQDGAALLLSADLVLAKNTDAYTVTFDLPITATDAVIYGGFNNVTFDENCTVTGTLDFYGGVLSFNDETTSDTAVITELDYTITVKDGTFRHFAGGNFRATYTDMIGAVAAPLTVNISGGTFTDSFNLSGDSFLSDNVTLTISGGTFSCPLYVRSVSTYNQAKATRYSPTVTSDAKYYAMDGDIAINISGGIFNGGLISAYDADKIAYTQLLRGKYTVTVEGGTFADGTEFDATQVKAYDGETDDLASITYPDTYTFTTTRFDSVNGVVQEYDEPLRVAFIGDSITEGVGSGAPLTKSYPAVFAGLAATDHPDIIVANYGISGAGALPGTTNYYLDRLGWPVLTEETDADYIVLALGTNDNTAGGINVNRLAFENSYKNIIETLGALPCTEKLFITNAIARGTDATSTAQMRVASVVRPLQERIAKAYAAEDPDKFIFVDLYGLTVHSAAEGPLLGADNLHPNATGYEAMADAIYGAIFNGVTVPATDYRHGDVYLRADGKPYASGTEDDPTSSLAHAMALMPYDGEGTLHISGTISCAAYVSTSSLPKKLTIVGEGEGAVLEATGYETFKLLSDVKFDNITLKTTVEDMYLIAGYNSAEFTESVTFEGNWSFVAGLYASASDTVAVSSAANDCTITLNCTAAFNRLLLGNCRFAGTAPFGTYSGDMTVTVGDNVTFSGNAGAVGQNYLTGSVAVSLPHGLTLSEYADIGTDTNSVYDTANNTGTISITNREAPAAPEVVYLSAGATGTGLTAASPIGTLADAYALLDAEKGGTVVFMDKYTLAARIDLPAHTGTIKWTSVYGDTDYRTNGATLMWTASVRVGFGGPTVIDDFIFTDDGGGVLAANFHPLTIGESVQTLNADGEVEAKSAIIGGPNVDTTVAILDEGESSALTILSGSYKVVVAFSRAVSNRSHLGTMTLNIGGDVTVTECILGAYGTSAVGGSTILNLTDESSIGTLHLANYESTAVTNGTVTVNAHDNAVIGAIDAYDASLFAKENARSLNYALTASVPSEGYFDSITLIDVGYLTVADRTAEGLTLASVDALDVTAYVTEADSAITLPYPSNLTSFTLKLLYSGETTTAETYAVTVTDGVATAALTSSETFNGSVVYVADGGTGYGFTPETPCATIAAAQALLPNGGTIVLIGEVTGAKATLPDHSGIITYTSVYNGVDYRENGARLFFPTAVTFQLGGETLWKDISIHTTTYSVIAAAFHPITFDTGVVVTHDADAEDVNKSDSTRGIYIVGGYNRVTLGEVTVENDSFITLRSGSFRRVWASDRLTGKTTHTGTTTVVVEGTAWVDELVVGASGNSATSANAHLTLKDDAIIQNLYMGGKERDNYLTGTFDFVIYGGDIYEIDRCSLHTATGTQTLTYDVSTAPEGYPYLAELAWFDVIQTFCERDNTHSYSDPYASEFDASIQLKRCSVCGDIQIVSNIPEAIEGNYVFVAEGGLGDGSHPSIPTSDLYAAFKKLESSGGTIVIMNAYTLQTNTKQKLGGAPAFFQEPLHEGAITVTSVYGETDYRESGAKFIFDGNVDYKLGGPVTFDHIVFDATADTTENTIAARYNPIVIGEDVEMLRDMDDSYKLDLIGGYKYFRYTDFTDVTIEDGLIEMVTPARILTADPETGDYTIDDPVYLVVNDKTTNQYLRAEAANAFNKMFDDMGALGLKEPTGIAYAWRGYHQQYDGYTRQLADYRINQNKTYTQAHNWVITHCSIPGASEHHLGYAFDFHDASLGENAHFKYDQTEEWAWIMQNGYKYGIILRFTPKDKYVTGFIYEAWHFRYVGVEHATAIAKLNSDGDPVSNAEALLTPEWCLEDYAGLTLGMYDLDASVTVNGGTFANVEGGSRYCDDLPLTGENTVTIGEKATVKPEGTTYDLVFFSDGAAGDGLSAQSPIGTLAQAYAKLGADGGTLVWMSEFSISTATEMPAHEGTVTITSVYGDVDYRETNGAALKYTAGVRFAFNGPTVIENFKIINGSLLCANFNPLELGEDVLTVDADGNAAATITLIGGGNNNTAIGTLDAGETNTITVKSGTYKQIVAFSAYDTNLSHTGTVNLNISGDVAVTSIYLGAKATGSCGGSTVLTLSDNATIGTLYLANQDESAITNGTVTVYALDNSSIGAISPADSTLFATENARTLYYEETATLPESLETYFDNITMIDGIERTGDANGDGKTNLLDVLRILKAVTDENVTVSKAADMDQNGAIDIQDVLLVLQSILSK